MRGRAAAALLLALSACAAEPEAAAPPLSLDCSQPYETLQAAVTSQQLVKAPGDPAEPYEYYSTPDGKASYLLTKPGAPGHPAILMQQVKGGEVVTTGCPYGDAAGYEQIRAYLESLKAWRRK